MRLGNAPLCTWEKPKGFRVSRKQGTDELCFFVDGPENGAPIRRASKMGTGKTAVLVSWRLPPLIDRGCWYAYDPLDDVYHHVCPMPPPPKPKKPQVRKRKASILVDPS